jgi:SAM-dependent methyltransferase
MEQDELRRRIDAFPRWHYRFEFAGGASTPVRDRDAINRQHQRHAHFFERLLSVTGGSLHGLRVLDVGCNAGFWSLAAHRAGADFVHGLDLKQEYIEQAQLVFEANGVDPSRYCFEQADLFEYELDDQFDVVLCLGVLGHVDRPVELFKLISATGAQLIVIECSVSRSRASLFEITQLYNARDVVGDGLALIPSRQAVVDLAAQHGFSTVALAPSFTDDAGMGDYRRERRCAFICSRGIDLDGLPVEQRPVVVPWWVRDPGALLDV